MSRAPDSRLLPIIFPRAPKEEKEILPWSMKLIASLEQLKVALGLFISTNDPALMTGNITLGDTDVSKTYISNGARTVTLGLTGLYLSFMWTEFLATGGDITFTPDAGETVQTGVAGVSYTLASGSSGRLYHTAGKWWII